jgi:hypothetical protein
MVKLIKEINKLIDLCFSSQEHSKASGQITRLLEIKRNNEEIYDFSVSEIVRPKEVSLFIDIQVAKDSSIETLCYKLY